MNFLCRAAVIAALCVPAGIAASPTAAQTDTRHYDCSKPGNADKTACKNAAANTAPAASEPSDKTKTTTRHYDCTKAGNADKEACKTAAARTSDVNNDPRGATAQCKDGTYTHAAHHEGACADHGGVTKWLSN